MNKTILTGILCAISNFLQADPVQSESRISLLNTIIENEKECVRGYEEEDGLNKIYLHHELIVVTEHGLFLSLNNGPLRLPLLQSDQNGCFLGTELSAGFSKLSSRGPCPNCTKPTDSSGICRNPNCFFNGIQVIQ